MYLLFSWHQLILIQSLPGAFLVEQQLSAHLLLEYNFVICVVEVTIAELYVVTGLRCGGYTRQTVNAGTVNSRYQSVLKGVAHLVILLPLPVNLILEWHGLALLV